MQCHFIREQRHVCGENYQEVDLFPVTERQHRASRRSKKRLASTMAQMELNEKNARRHFGQVAHTNFTADDLICHYTYNDEHHPKSDEKAQRNLQKYIDRLNYRRQQLSLPPCKYMGVTEKRGKRGIRYHHHIIMDGLLSDREMKSLWAVGRGRNRQRLGGARIDTLDFEGFGGTITALCEYITKDPVGKRRWTQSHGLRQPERPRPNDGKYSRAAVAKLARERLDDAEYWRHKYPGWELVEPARSYYNDYTGWSIYAKLRPTQPRARPAYRSHI